MRGGPPKGGLFVSASSGADRRTGDDEVVRTKLCRLGPVAASAVCPGKGGGRTNLVVPFNLIAQPSASNIDRATGKAHVGYVPPYSVVVSGSLPGKPLPDGSPGPSLYCAVIVKTVDAQTRAKTGINELCGSEGLAAADQRNLAALDMFQRR
jgi:hypothetical protein